MNPAIDILFSVPDIRKLLFSWLDPSSLALAAWVCKQWRIIAREARGEEKKFRLILADLVPYTPTLIWVDANITKLPGIQRSMLCRVASSKGALATLQWARANGYSWGWATCAAAARYGHLEVLRWALENGCPRDLADCSERAHGNGQPAIVAWIAAQTSEVEN